MADGCCGREAPQGTRGPPKTGEPEPRGGFPPRARLEASTGDLCPRQPDVDESRAEHARSDQPPRRGAHWPVVDSEGAVVAVEGGCHRRRARAAPGQDQDRVERPQREAGEQHRDREQERADGGDGDVTRPSRPRGSAQGRIFPSVGWDRSQARQQQERDERGHPPDLDRDHGGKRKTNVAQGRGHVRPAKPAEDEIHDAGRAAEQEMPHHSARDGADQPGQEQEDPQRRAPLKRAAQQISDAEPDHELERHRQDRKSTRLNSSHLVISYAVFCLKKKMRQARHLDEELATSGPRGPLHGIPVGCKDIVYTAGLKTTACSSLFADFVPSYDATVVRRLKQAGAIIIGKTVCTEFAVNDPPPTAHAWKPSHTPGGSSSGSAVAVATRMCFATVDTQTAGDIRRPAAYNGIVGLKPTY